MTLFEHRRAELAKQTAPLATRMRPRRLEEFVGQEHLVGEGRVLRGAIESDRVPSMILWGPPGSGKTTLARLIAGVTEAHFNTISAVSSGVADIRRVVADARERLLRSLADFDNYKKRAERERSDLRRFAAIEPLKDFLPILDNLELAMSSKGSFEDLKSGVDLIVSQMKKLLARFGVAEIVAEGQPFDPSRHDAIARFEDASVSEQTVAEELQKGYLIKGRLLRAAMVRVAVPIDSKEEVEEGPD